MTTDEFEKQLQDEVDSTISFRQNPGNLDIKGIYYGDIYTETSIPSREIKLERDAAYTDNFGYPHRGANEAKARVQDFITRFKTDEQFRHDILGDE